MSQAIASPADCCSPAACSPASASTPGPQGPAGADGADGADGVSPITFVANYNPDPQPTMPAEGASTTVEVTSSTLGFEVGQPVFVQNWGTMFVTNVAIDSLTLQNPENTASGTYASNAAPGTPLAATSKITPGGIQGPAGITPAGALLAASNLGDLTNFSTARGNLGLGTAAQAVLGIGNGQVAPNDGALTSGEFVQATATGLQTVDDATARSDMGLGTMATQNAGAVNITGGALNGTLGATVPATAAVTTLAASGAATFSGAAGFNADVTASAKVFTPSSAIQSLAAGNAVSPNAAFVRVAGSGGAVTITATPSITNPAADGQRLVIMGTDDTNTITLQDKSVLGGSNLNLAGDANVTLGAGDIIELIWQSTLAGWYEISRSLN